MRNRLRLLVSCFCVVLCASLAHAGEGKGATTSPQRFGAPITVRKPTQLAKVAKQPAKFEGKVLRLEGVVGKVCQGAGCWIEIESKGVTFLAKSLDESVLVPKDCAGQRVVVQGVLTERAAKGHEGHDHSAAGHDGHDHAAGAHEAAETHECPEPTFLLATQGIELTEAKK